MSVPRDYRYWKSVSRARELRVKEGLKKLFPSFEEEINRLRIRHHIELMPLIWEKDKHLRARDLQQAFQDAQLANMGYPNSEVRTVADTEYFISKTLGKGQFFGKRTYATRYFPDSWKAGIGLRHSDVHEFAHYLTSMLLKRNFGKRTVLRNVVPASVHEAISFAFQARYLEESTGGRARVDLNKIADAYGFKGMERELFKDVFRSMYEEIKKHGLDGAARRIPDVVQRHLNLPRKQFKQR